MAENNQYCAKSINNPINHILGAEPFNSVDNTAFTTAYYVNCLNHYKNYVLFHYKAPILTIPDYFTQELKTIRIQSTSEETL